VLDRSWLWLALVVGIAFVVRCLAAFVWVNVFHSYEMFQELEQGHRLAFGSGVAPFEFVYGYRSWLMPGLIAGVMKISSWLSSNPLLYIYTLRLLAIAASLGAVVSTYLIAARVAGQAWGLASAFISAIWFQGIYFAPFLMPEVFAAYVALIAVVLADAKEIARPSHRAALIGVLLGLAFCLRFQMAPALAVIAAWYSRAAWRERWLSMSLAALAVVLPVLGLLDFLTWGGPFQSVWLHVQMNVGSGVADEFGSASPLYYFVVLLPSLHSLPIAIVLGWLAAIGAFRTPLLACTALVLVVSHTLIAHKEYRFICFALIAMPAFIGLGLATIGEIVKRQFGLPIMAGAATLVVALVSVVSYYEFHGLAIYRYTHNAGTLRSMVVAGRARNVCGLGVADFTWYDTGGYTYFHRNVPIYFANALTRTPVADLYGTYEHRQLALATRFVLNNASLRQYTGRELFKHTQSFNYLIAEEGHLVGGYSPVRCFSSGPAPLKSTCLLARAGTCTDAR